MKLLKQVLCTGLQLYFFAQQQRKEAQMESSLAHTFKLLGEKWTVMKTVG